MKPPLSKLRPMEAVRVLYDTGSEEEVSALFTSLSRAVFERRVPGGAPIIKRILARVVVPTIRLRTRRETDAAGHPVYRNRLLESSGHSYARMLMQPSAGYVEGGEPMNAVYLMLSPEIARNAGLWDRLLVDSVQGRETRRRFYWETRLVHAEAERCLAEHGSVNLHAYAAGTGLSMMLVVDRLLEHGHGPERIRAVISDHDPAHARKAIELARKLPRLRTFLTPETQSTSGLSIREQDLFVPDPDAPAVDIATAVGILEYFHGETLTTSEELLGEKPDTDGPEAAELLRAVCRSLKPGAKLVVNSYRLEPAGRMLEAFGKRFRFRTREQLHALARQAGLEPTGEVCSGCIYDVEVFRKRIS